MLHRSTLDKASRPGLRFQGWKALPVGSKIAIIVLGLIALIAILAPVVAPYSPNETGLAVANEGRQLRCLTVDADHRLTHGLRFHDAVQHHRGTARRLKQPDQGKGTPLGLITQGRRQHRNAAITAPQRRALIAVKDLGIARQPLLQRHLRLSNTDVS